jgi:hypothetical protein
MISRLFLFCVFVCAAAGQTAQTQQKSPALPETEAAARKRAGMPGQRVFSFIHAYEPNEGGYTVDQADDSFLDFTLSLFIPLMAPSKYPALERAPDNPASFARPIRFQFERLPTPFFAMTERAGQYIGTRDSSPVVNKRFNPVFGLRWWAAGPQETEDNFLELVYAHESNGQHVGNEAQFNAQMAAYLKRDTVRADGDNAGEAFRSARDNLSRGWDYVGIQWARDWNVDWPVFEGKVGSRLKFNYYLPWGLMQRDAEDYKAWEHMPDGKWRRTVDGVSLRLTAVRPGASFAKLGWVTPFERNALILTTGYSKFGRYNTIQAETGFSIKEWPIIFWYRYGYNRDLIDYYHKDHSFGVKLSIWKFQAL